MQQTCKHKCKKSWKKMQLLAVPFFAFFLGASGLQKLKKLQKLEENAKHNAEKKKQKKTKNMQKNMQKKVRKKCNFWNCAFLHFWWGLRLELQNLTKTAKTQGTCKNNAKNMRKRCQKKATNMQILELCMCCKKNKFLEVACFLLAFVAEVFGVALSGCIVFAFVLHFNQALDLE